eukprot:1156402-Pelagomonas_calceolata.AAC.8
MHAAASTPGCSVVAIEEGHFELTHLWPPARRCALPLPYLGAVWQSFREKNRPAQQSVLLPPRLSTVWQSRQKEQAV